MYARRVDGTPSTRQERKRSSVLPRRYNPAVVHRLPRILRSAPNLLSLAIFLFTAILWPASFHEDSRWDLHQHDNVYRAFIAHRGQFALVERTPLIPPPEATTLAWAMARPKSIRRWHGFELASGEDVGKLNLFLEGRPNFVNRYARLRYVAAPAWFIVSLSAVLPALALRRHLRTRRAARRTAANRCPTCNYDLRATSDRCPECGQVPPRYTARQPKD